MFVPNPLRSVASVAALGLATLSPGSAIGGQPANPPTSNYSVPVLMYHRISALTAKEKTSAITVDLTVPPQQFEMQIQALQQAGYTFFKASEVAEAVATGKPLPQKAVSITMDDGYADNYEVAFPILRKYHVPATIFVITSAVGSAGHVTWANLREMQQAGVEAQSHSVTHPDLPSLTGKRLDSELANSRKSLEAQLKAPITTLAYPAGRYSDEVVEHTKSAGYLAAWKKSGGPVKPGDSLFLLPRVRVTGTESIGAFKRSVGITTVKKKKAQ